MPKSRAPSCLTLPQAPAGKAAAARGVCGSSSAKSAASSDRSALAAAASAAEPRAPSSSSAAPSSACRTAAGGSRDCCCCCCCPTSLAAEAGRLPLRHEGLPPNSARPITPSSRALMLGDQGALWGSLRGTAAAAEAQRRIGARGDRHGELDPPVGTGSHRRRAAVAAGCRLVLCRRRLGRLRHCWLLLPWNQLLLRRAVINEDKLLRRLCLQRRLEARHQLRAVGLLLLPLWQLILLS